MKLITRNTDYAIRALCFIAKHKDEIVTVPQLTKCLRVPKPFLRKLLQILNQKKILKSFKGQGGGFELAVAAERINVANLIRIFQGQLQINVCSLKKKLCPDTSMCNLRKKIGLIERYIINELSSITVASLLR